MADAISVRPRKIFISSTYEDLRPYVDAAQDVVASFSFEVEHFKHWGATGGPSAFECKERVQRCDALIVIVGSTYGWVPPVDQGGDGHSSITRLEVRWAREQTLPVMPFFVRPPGDANGSAPLARDVRLDDFVAELRTGLSCDVLSVGSFRQALERTLVEIDERLGVTEPPAVVGESRQGRYAFFHDRIEVREDLRSAFVSKEIRAAFIVGKGGFGKSALANCAVDDLRRSDQVDTVIFLNPEHDLHFDGHDLFMATMEADGRPKLVCEAAWPALYANESQLVKVLLDVYRHRRILLLLDALERNVDGSGAVAPPILHRFLEEFVLAHHSSKLLITTRRAPILSAATAPAIMHIPLDSGLRVSDSLSLLLAALPRGTSPPENLKDVIPFTNGIPFVLERVAYLVQKTAAVNFADSLALDGPMEEFVALAHSTLSTAARMTLKARSIFDDPVPPDALTFVLAPEIPAGDVTAAIDELSQGKFLFPTERDQLLGIHDFDKTSSYQSLAHDKILDLRRLHRRAAEYFARDTVTGKDARHWRSFDQFKNDIRCFRHFVRAGDPAAAANVFDIGKLWFLNWAGHLDLIGAMFKDLDVGEEKTRASLMKKFALADALVVIGPFDKAISEMKSIIELARELADTEAELAATYDLGLAFRYSGKGDDAAATMQSMLEKARAGGDSPWLGRSLFGYSLACTYSSRYAEAIQSGLELIAYADRVDDEYYVAGGNNCLCLAYYLVGRMADARRCAKSAADSFINTTDEHMVGFNENVHGLALHALGDSDLASQAFHRARTIAKKTAQRRAEGLAATNWAWLFYSEGAIPDALEQIADAAGIFAATSLPDKRLVRFLREAFESARDCDRKREAQELWKFVRSDYVNPDLIRRVAVAERIVALGSDAPSEVREDALAFVASERDRFSAFSDS